MTTLTEPNVTYGCWQGRHERCVRIDCDCECHVGRQMPLEGIMPLLDGLPQLLHEVAAEAAAKARAS